MIERTRTVDVFGGQVRLAASGVGADGLGASAALVLAEALLREVHERLTPYERTSELSRLNDDPLPYVRVSPVVRRLVAAVRPAGELSGGLVDATLGGVVLDGGGWRHVEADPVLGLAVRPPGVRIDPNGLAKGLAADLAARRLRTHPSFVVECLGDLRTGGTDCRRRPIAVADPFGSTSPVATLGVRDGAVATSGITKRGNHIVDPRTREPADTGVVQATALAPSALEAEVRAKAALLAGAEHAAEHLPHGGVLVLADGGVLHVPAFGAPRGGTLGTDRDLLLADPVAA